MNREILFRGKRVDNDEWVYGFLVKMFGVLNIADKDNENIIYEVIPETVGQFIGLPDKNSNKIFEGDIVYNGVFKAQVELINGRFSPFGSDMFFADECEVIGNIYDNKELLGCTVI